MIDIDFVVRGGVRRSASWFDFGQIVDMMIWLVFACVGRGSRTRIANTVAKVAFLLAALLNFLPYVSGLSTLAP